MSDPWEDFGGGGASVLASRGSSVASPHLEADGPWSDFTEPWADFAPPVELDYGKLQQSFQETDQLAAQMLPAPGQLVTGEPAESGPEDDNLLKAFWTDINTPLLEVVKPLSGEEHEALKQDMTPGELRTLGAQESLGGLVNFFTSPLGIGTLGIGALPKIAQRAIGLAFGGAMLHGANETTKAIETEMSKPEGERDQRLLGQLFTDFTQAGGFATLGAWAGTKPTATPAEIAGRLLEKEVKRADLGGTSSTLSRTDPIVRDAVERVPPVPEGSIGPWNDFKKPSPPRSGRGQGEVSSSLPETPLPVPETTLAPTIEAAPARVAQPTQAAPPGAGEILPEAQPSRPGVGIEATKPEPPSQPGGPVPTTPPTEPPVKRVVRGISAYRRFERETELGGPDILSFIQEFGGMVSKTEARRSRGKEWWQQNASLYDDAAPLAGPHHNIIYKAGRNYPDQVAQAAYDAGVLKAPDVNELWTAMRRASNRRAVAVETLRREERNLQAEVTEHESWMKATAKGEQRINADQLKVGDVMEIEGERVEVIAIDPDSGDVMLKDGRKFGKQTLTEGQSVHVEKFNPIGNEDWLPPEEQPKPELPKVPEAARSLTPKEQNQYEELTLKLRANRESGGPALTTAETQRYEQLLRAVGQGDLLNAPEGGASGRIEELRARYEQLNTLRQKTQTRAWESTHRGPELIAEAKAYQAEMDRTVQLIRQLEHRQKAEADILEHEQAQPASGGDLFGTSAVGFPVGAPVPAIPAPAPAPGITMIQHGFLPVTLPRTAEGSVSIPQIMKSLVNVQRVAGTDAGSIRTGRFYQKALGIFKPHEEIIRLGAADDIPTATHEVGHALQKQLYGTTKASGLKVLPGDVRRELVGLGRALYGTRKSPAGYTGEGFAEFMRYWLTTEDAAKVAPKTTAFFESQVLPKYPDVANALADARGQLDIWRYQGSVERAKRQTVREPGAFARIAKALGGLVSYQGQFESGAPLEAVSKAAARKLGRPLPPSQDPFKLFSAKRGSAGATVERMAMNNMLDIWGNPVGPSLAEALAPVKNQRKEFGLYVFAKAAEMRWRQGKNPGISLEDAQHIKGLYDSPEFQLAAQKYFDWMNGGLDYLVQADPSMADVVAKIRGANDFYAPLARLIDPVAAKRAAAQARSNPLMRMHGSGLPVKDIFDQSFANMARLVNRAHKAMVTNAVVKVAELPGLGHLIEEVPRARVMEHFNFEKIRQQLEDSGVDTSAIPADEQIQYASLADAPKGSDPIIAVKRADGTHWYHVDPRLYDALEGLQTYSLKNAFPNLPGLGAVLDLVAGAPARAFRLGTTGLRAPFSLITNPTRDLQTLLAQTSVNPARVAAEYPAAVAGVIREGLGGKGSPHVEAFYNLGAHMGQPLGIDIQHTKRVSNELFHGRVLRVVKNPVDHLRQLLSITEAAPRVAELTAIAREVGWTPGTKMTPDQAVQMALGAKQVTVDFSAAGNVSRVVNAAVPFYNPGVQGLRSFARALRDHPARSVLLGAAVFTAPALLNWWKNKDKEWYRMLPWRERYTYNNIDDGTNVWRIPRPFEWGNAFQVMPEALLDSWYRRDPEAVKRAVGHIFETTNPLDLPVVAKIAKEQWSNRIAFWDRPIVPRGEQDLPKSMQVGPYTTKLAVGINRAFPNVSPRRVDAALRSYFGGTAGDLLGALGLGANQVDREWERSDLPVLGTLFRRGGEFNAQNQAISDFYDAWLPAKAKVDAQRQLANRQATGGASSTSPNLNITPQDYVSASVGDEASKAITVLLRLANSAKETRARQELYRTAGELAQQANAVMKNTGTNQPAR